MTTGNAGGSVVCSRPLDAALLADYWLAVLLAPDEEAVELHLLQCDPCGARLREVIALSKSMHRLAREGSLRMIVSDASIQRAKDEGLRVRQYDVPAGGSVHCTVTADDDLLIARLAANLAGAQRVDLSLCDQQGREQLRLPDIPVHPGSDSVLYQESITFAKAAPDNVMIARLLAFDESGIERLAGEYTFHHMRTMPGPGA